MQIAGIGGATAVAEVLHEHGMDYDLHAALMLGKTDEIRKILKDPDAVKKATNPGRLIEQAVSMIWQFSWQLRDPGAHEAGKKMVRDNIDILESLWAQNVPAEKSSSAMYAALQLPDPLIAEALLKHGAPLEYHQGPKPMDLLSVAQMNRYCAPEMSAMLSKYGVADTGQTPAETPEAVLDLCKAMKSDNAMARVMVITSLGAYAWRARAAVPDLLQALKDKDENIRACAAQSLKMIDPAAATKAGIK
jgi:hypothetical protein